MADVDTEVARATEGGPAFSHDLHRTFRNRKKVGAWILSALQVFGVGSFLLTAKPAKAAGAEGPAKTIESSLLLPVNSAFTGDLVGNTTYSFIDYESPDLETDRFQKLMQIVGEEEQKGDWKAAAAHLLEASRLREFDEGQMRSLALAQRMAGQYDAALRTSRYNFERNFARQPSVDTASDLCESLIATGNFPEARSLMVEILTKLDLGPALPCIRGEVEKMAIRDWQIEINLDRQKLMKIGQDRFDQTGCYECYVPLETSSIVVTGAEKHKEIRDQVGNRVLQIWTLGNQPVRVTIQISVGPMFQDLSRQDVWKGIDAVPNEVRTFLGKTPGIDPTTKTVAEIAGSLKRPTCYETICAVNEWIDGNITPTGKRPAPTGPVPKGTDGILITGLGFCGPQADAACALLRHLGIPARSVVGFASMGSKVPGWHTWNEVWSPKLGWVPIRADGRNGTVNLSYLRIAADSPLDEPAESETNTCWRIYHDMTWCQQFLTDQNGEPLNVKATLVRMCLGEGGKYDLAGFSCLSERTR